MLDLSDVAMVDLGSVECLNFILLHPKRHVVQSEDNVPLLELVRASGQSFSTDGIVSIICETPMGMPAIAMDVGLVDALSDRFVPGWRQPEAQSLPFEWRAIVALEKFVQQTPFSTMPCRILNVLCLESSDEGGGLLFGKALMDGQAYGVGVAFRDGVLPELEKYIGLPSAVHNLGLDNFMVQLEPRIEGAFACYADIRNLDVGDIILLPFCKANNVQLSLQIDAQHSWVGTCDFQGNFTMTSKGAQP